MSYYIFNGSPETINVALLLYDPSCTVGGQPWRKVGWYVLNSGQTIVPDVYYNVDLTTVNGWVGLYAYTASGDADWQGTGNAWFAVSDGAYFSQCGEDETNTSKWVDFEGVYFGWPSVVSYLYTDATGIITNHPEITIVTDRGVLYVSGLGFVPGSTVSITYEYVYDGNLTSNSGSPSMAAVDSYGVFVASIYVSTLLYPGDVTVQAVDSGWGLSSTGSATFPEPY